MVCLGGSMCRIRGEIQDLVEGRMVGDEAGILQLGAGAVELHGTARELTAQGLVGIPAQAVCIGHGNQEEIQGQRVCAATLQVPLTDQTVIDPTELGWDTSEPVGYEGCASSHG
jgi:hypothetical protein